MKLRVDAPRALGAAYLIVILTSLVSGVVLSGAVGNGSISDVLRNAADNEGAVRLSVVVAMLNSAGIVCLASLLYVVLGRYGKAIAFAGVGMWIGEAVFYALAWLGAAGLIPLGQDFVRAGASEAASYLSLGSFLYDGVYRVSSEMLMFFYCAGGFLFYYLFFVSRVVPRLISGYGLAAVALATVGVVLELLGNGSLMVLMVPLLLFELGVGLWLLIKGIPEAAATVYG